MNARCAQTGSSMIEVLITLVILLVGLLGLAGLMAQGQRSEMESYQRVQALILLQDMLGRINANRAVASCYEITDAATGTPYLGTPGVGILATIPPACAVGTAAQRAMFQSDITDWDALLNGAAETSGGASVGAMVGARGCVSYDPATELLDSTEAAIAGTGIYTLSVAWQGLGSTFENTNLLCGQGLYGSEAQRRVVSLTFRVGSINNSN